MGWVLPILKKLINDKYPDVRSSAAIALGRVGETVPDKVLLILENLAEDKDSDVRSSAVSSLGEIGRACPY